MTVGTLFKTSFERGIMDTKPAFGFLDFDDLGDLVLSVKYLPMAVPPGVLQINPTDPVGGVIISMVDTSGRKSFLIRDVADMETIAQELLGACAVARKLVQDYKDRESRESN